MTPQKFWLDGPRPRWFETWAALTIRAWEKNSLRHRTLSDMSSRLQSNCLCISSVHGARAPLRPDDGCRLQVTHNRLRLHYTVYTAVLCNTAKSITCFQPNSRRTVVSTQPRQPFWSCIMTHPPSTVGSWCHSFYSTSAQRSTLSTTTVSWRYYVTVSPSRVEQWIGFSRTCRSGLRRLRLPIATPIL